MSGNFLPNLFVPGAAKSGTTSLYALLDKYPTVCMSIPKEPFFFEAEYEKGLAFYQKKYFSHWNNEKYIGDARHRNLYLPFIPERIHQVNPDAKFIIILRQPADRAFAHWWHWYSREMETLSFEEAILADLERINSKKGHYFNNDPASYSRELDTYGKTTERTYVDSGFYDEQIKRILVFFPMNQIKVILLEELYQNIEAVAGEISAFLDTDMPPKEKLHASVSNPHAIFLPKEKISLIKKTGLGKLIPRQLKQKLLHTASRKFHTHSKDEKSIKLLRNIYRPHIDELEKLIKKDLRNWK